MHVDDSSDYGAEAINRRFLPFLFLIGVALIAYCLHANHLFFHDDAFITLRYARHVIEGKGFVWNASGPRVEGFTSPLHMLLVAAIGSLGIPLPWAARGLNFACHFVLVCVAFVYVNKRAGSLAAGIAALQIAASWNYLIWDLGGLEAVMFGLLGTLGCLAGCRVFEKGEQRPQRWAVIAGFLLALAALTRPETLIILTGYCAMLLVLPNEARFSRPLLLLRAVCSAAIVLIPVEVFRMYYFHAIAPNTAYAKLSGIDPGTLLRMGFVYAAHFYKSPALIGPLFTVSAAIAVFKSRFERRDLALTFLVLCNTLFLVVSGGDHMINSRFCLLIYSLLAILLALTLKETGILSSRSGALAACVVVVATLALQMHAAYLNPRSIDGAAGSGRDVGKYIVSRWRPDSLVALNTAGSTPFFADNMRYIDMLGLNDAEIARRKSIPENGPWTRIIGHMKGDGASVLRRRPDYIILGPADGTTPEERKYVFFIGDYEISRSPIFQQEYSLCRVPLNSGDTFEYYRHIATVSACT